MRGRPGLVPSLKGKGIRGAIPRVPNSIQLSATRLGQCFLVIEIATVKMSRASEVRLSGRRPETKRGLSILLTPFLPYYSAFGISNWRKTENVLDPRAASRKMKEKRSQPAVVTSEELLFTGGWRLLRLTRRHARPCASSIP